MRLDPPPLPRHAWLPVLMLAALLLQAPLVLNPGYFSHDELQWAVRATDGGAPDWRGIDALQYRPLTFALWRLLSRALFETPRLFHLAVCALGALNAAMLAAVLRRAGASTARATLGALAFVASPAAMYTHGWVGTLGDIAWVACALAAAWLVLAGARGMLAGVALLTAAALLAKESALSMPALAVVAALVDVQRRPRWRSAALVSGLVALGYLTMRHRGLAATPASGAYTWHVANIPGAWLQYHAWPLLPRVFEVHNAWAASSRLAAALAVGGVIALGVVLVRASRRGAVAFVAGGAAALGPVLVLDQPATQYGYALAAWGAGISALAWPRLDRAGRAIAGAAAAASVLHGANVARLMWHVGALQAAFSPALADALSRTPGVLRLVPERAEEAWVYTRLTHEIPAYRGVAIGNRVQIVAAGATADLRIAADGRLRPPR